MDDSTTIAIIFGAIIYLVIIWNIISSATRSRSILKLQRRQVEILKEIALKSGVEAEAIETIIKEHNI